MVLTEWLLLFKDSEEHGRFAGERAGALEVAGGKGALGLGDEGARVAQQAALVGGQVRLLLSCGAPSNLLENLHDLMPLSGLLGRTFARLEHRDFGSRCGLGFDGWIGRGKADAWMAAGLLRRLGLRREDLRLGLGKLRLSHHERASSLRTHIRCGRGS